MFDLQAHQKSLALKEIEMLIEELSKPEYRCFAVDISEEDGPVLFTQTDVYYDFNREVPVDAGIDVERAMVFHSYFVSALQAFLEVGALPGFRDTGLRYNKQSVEMLKSIGANIVEENDTYGLEVNFEIFPFDGIDSPDY